MSVQLIIYPQSYEGTHNAISGTPSEFIVDGINFNTINTSTQYVASAPFPQNAINHYAPTLTLNSWVRYRGGGATVSEASGDVLFPSGTSGNEDCGIIQKLSNLTIGIDYTVSVDIALVSATADLFVNTYNGTILNSTATLTQSVGVVSTTFTANATDQTILIGTSGIGTIIVSSISTQQVSGLTVASLSDGQVICDLYEDEDIPLSLSVDDFKNVAEKVQSYSKAFNLPATKRNNRIFDQIFEITRSDDGVIFNPYKKTQCVLKQDGFILFEGYLRLLDVTDKEGEISYNVNLYSEVVALVDVLKDRAFRDLDFTELSHDYNRTQIKYSWNDGITSGQTTPITWTNANTSGFRTDFETLKYPFVDWNHQFIVGGSSNSGNSATVGNPELTSLEQAFRPFINIKYLIDRIFEETPFTYESALFDTTDFKKLYMDFNWGSAEVPNVTGINSFNGQWAKQISSVISASVYAGTTFTNLVLKNTPTNNVPPNYDLATNIITATTDGEQYNISGGYRIENTSTTVTQVVDCQWLYNSIPIAVTQLSIPPSSYGDFTTNFNQILLTGDTLQAQFKRNNPFSTATVRMYEDSITPTSNITFNVNTIAITTNILLQTLRGETGQWDFLKGLLTMFNLVTLPDENNPNNILIEPYADVFLNNTATPLDWTEKIDVSEMKLEPLADLNKKTIFKFVEDDDDYAFTNYKNLVGGHLYGSRKFPLVPDDRFNILVGEDEIVAEPFAATVVKPLMSQFPSFITPALYSYNADDGTSEGFDNSPRIMYNNGVKSTGASYYIPAQNGGTSTNETNYLQFSHLTDVPTVVGSKDFHFGECQLLTGVGSSVPDNLFNLYWLPYYSELYNPNTRIMTIKVNLTPADINTFKFNDTVFLKNRTFRVNKIDYKPNDLATVEFILIP